MRMDSKSRPFQALTRYDKGLKIHRWEGITQTSNYIKLTENLNNQLILMDNKLRIIGVFLVVKVQPEWQLVLPSRSLFPQQSTKPIQPWLFRVKKIKLSLIRLMCNHLQFNLSLIQTGMFLSINYTRKDLSLPPQIAKQVWMVREWLDQKCITRPHLLTCCKSRGTCRIYLSSIISMMKSKRHRVREALYSQMVLLLDRRKLRN
jgi:hypothetical protein